jgi:hypothetical protein
MMRQDVKRQTTNGGRTDDNVQNYRKSNRKYLLGRFYCRTLSKAIHYLN